MNREKNTLPLVWIDGATGTLGQAVTGWLHPSHRVLTLCRTRPDGDWPFPVETFPEDPDGLKKQVQHWVEKHGAPQGLVCLAGANLNRLFLKNSRAEFQSLLEDNFFHTISLVQEVLPYQMAAGGGSIVVASSLAARHPRTGQTAYAASKGALESWVKALAREVGPKQCRINAVAPGFIDSPMLEELSGARLREITDAIPLKRLGQPGEIAGLIEFLISEKSRYITGQIIPVTGGL